MRRLLFLPIIVWILSCSSEPTTQTSSFELEAGSEREIAYTDKADAFWVTRSGGYNSSPWHGLTASKRGYLEDLFISANGVLLPREAAEVTVDPVSLVRTYPGLGIRETWTLLDRQRTLLIELHAEEETHWTVQPAILGGSTSQDFEILTDRSVLNAHIKRLDGLSSSYPHLKIWFSQAMNWSPAIPPGKTLYSSFLTPRAEYGGSHRLAISVSLHKEDRELEHSPGWMERARSSRRDRLESQIDASHIKSNEPELDKALTWAHLSLNTLVMEQMGKGIYAGLPWFDDYWGRDAFISFTGAALVNGRFEDARDILLSFAELQNTEADDPNYGRVPNRAQPSNIIYNTTDGTPWFVRSVWEYYRYSGDEEFLKKMWPSIRHATLGSLKNWVDDHGLLRHDDADTWMDAKGPEGPWSPRGNRAIDIQFLWRDQLAITQKLAHLFDDPELEAAAQKNLEKSDLGLEQFKSTDHTYIVDHLNADDVQDTQIRPNVFLVPSLFNETYDWSTFKTLAPQLITRSGVLSLSQDDANFHPYHHQPGLYVQDAAYHNGIIWTWNSAASITPAVKFHQYHYAEALFNGLTDQILNRGAVGSIAELTDAWPKRGETRLSGTFSQAWSLAEYLRTFYQDILGFQPDLSKSKVSLAPRLLEDLTSISFRHPVGDDRWDVSYEESESAFEIDITRSGQHAVSLHLELLHASKLNHLDLTWQKEELHVRFEKQMGQWTVPGDIPDYAVSVGDVTLPINGLPFCEIDTTLEVPALSGPEHRLLGKDEVLAFKQPFQVIHKLEDSRMDDVGLTGNYVYPSNHQFEPGIADILSFAVGENESFYEFEMIFSNLVDPGWHAEYGYQLTYCALGVSYDSKSGSREIGKNAQDNFQKDFKADLILYISGGILVVDDKLVPLAEYMPQTSAGAIGNAVTETIRFTLPKSLFKVALNDASFQIAVGCQDDHGGAGIGDFRPVEALVSEWAGGGGSLDGSNVYDWLVE